MPPSPSMPSSASAHPSVFNLTESATINIRNAQYSLTVQASIPPHMGSSEGATLRIWLMKESNEHVNINSNVGSVGVASGLNHEFKKDSWYGEFDGAYVEAITRKTGNYKKFGVFVEMLLSSLKKANPTVHLDLLSSTDLLTLKSSLSAPVNLSHNQVSTDDKRYLILVYSVAYDRVHYPIPLIYHPVNAEPTMLINMIRDLQLGKERLERDCKATKEEIDKLQNENSSLRNNLQDLQTEKSSLEHQLQVVDSSRSSVNQERVISDLRQELDMMNRELEFARAECEKWRRNYDELKEQKQSKSRASLYAKRSTSYSGNRTVQRYFGKVEQSMNDY
ncbi:hypothetical protein BKA69DRAFT_1040117 [Paraphysoderma sedebokerense]|nr:hypothetical protein BKA69DRAFT_1040117 [Paraphysoderma sedebokerense]